MDSTLMLVLPGVQQVVERLLRHLRCFARRRHLGAPLTADGVSSP
jgi:hypothetical protein